jgi:hypothetical protein
MCPTPTLQVGEVIPGRFRQSNGWTILCAGPVAIAKAAAAEFATGAGVGGQCDRNKSPDRPTMSRASNFDPVASCEEGAANFLS